MAESQIKGVAIRDIVVEFFGSLLPGLMFLTAAGVVILWPPVSLVGISRQLSNGPVPDVYAGFVIPLLGDMEENRWMVAGVLFVMAYVVGQFFHRQDIKVPDKRSFRRIARELKPEDWVAATEKQCEFPYRNLKNYFRGRGLDHLSDMVPWEPEPVTHTLKTPDWSDVFGRARERRLKRIRRFVHGRPMLLLLLPRETRRRAVSRLNAAEPPSAGRNAECDAGGVQRTKMFLNAVKLRIFIHFPDKYILVARNEAHVRLNSSSWYMATLLMKLSFVTLLAYFAQTLLLAGRTAEGWVWIIPPSLPAFVLGVCWWARRTVERVLHYQRVREIAFVLESAYVLFRDRPWALQDLCTGYDPPPIGGRPRARFAHRISVPPTPAPSSPVVA